MSKREKKYRRQLIRMRLVQEAAMKLEFKRTARRFTRKFGNDPVIRNRKNFRFMNHSGLNRELIGLMNDFEKRLYKNILSGTEKAWEIGNDLNDEYVWFYFEGLDEFRPQKEAMLVRNIKARDAFITEKRNSRTLSDNVWKISKRYRDELEANLLIGVSEGKSASDIAIQTERYLKNPEQLFRRVRDPQGNLRLSNAAKLLKPEKGAYRSSYKNAFRVSRTRINAAYRKADYLRWQQQDFIIGYKVQLSAQHPRRDICDRLRGKYPKTFLFTGWHPQCFCYVTPIRMKREDFVQKLRGEKVDYQPIRNVPENMKEWISENGDKVRKMKNKPWFILDNFKVSGNSVELDIENVN